MSYDDTLCLQCRHMIRTHEGSCPYCRSEHLEKVVIDLARFAAVLDATSTADRPSCWVEAQEIVKKHEAQEKAKLDFGQAVIGIKELAKTLESPKVKSKLLSIAVGIEGELLAGREES